MGLLSPTLDQIERSHATGRYGSGRRLDALVALASRRMWWAWLIVVVALLINAFGWHAMRARALDAARAQFDFRETRIIQAIRAQSDAYSAVLRGARGLFAASVAVERDEWLAYATALGADLHYPGLLGIGMVGWVGAEGRSSDLESPEADGFGDVVLPAGRERHAPITHFVAFGNDAGRDHTGRDHAGGDHTGRDRAGAAGVGSTIGTDLWANPAYRMAMERARDGDDVRIAPIAAGGGSDADFVMFLPIYEEATPPAALQHRRQALKGFVFAPFRLDAFLTDVVGPFDRVILEIYQGRSIDPSARLYTSAGGDLGRHQPAFTDAQTVRVGGTTWTARFSSLPAFEATIDRDSPRLVLFGGLLITLLLAILIWILVHSRWTEALAADLGGALDERLSELARSRADLEQVAYVASHDLKAPLRGIDNLAGWIEEDLGDTLAGEPRENLALLRSRVLRLETLLDSLLSYSRAGRIEARIEHTDTGEVVRNLFDLLNGDGRFSLVLPGPLPVFETGKSAFEQVMNNLITNAIRHHDQQAGTITVGMREHGRFYTFAVSDDGPGIPPEYHERVMRMFHTLKPRDEVEGSGMGLAIVKKTVEHQGGEVRIESDGGRGTTIHVDWPKTWKREQ